jgi:molybdopterin/thiamine biosynthesis adenylyltransferase
MNEYRELFQVNLGIFTEEEMERIRATKVFIGGCGGLGGTMAIILARSGVENFILVDPDCFEPSNMNRQATCFVDTLGQNKAEVTAREIRRINPGARVKVESNELQRVRQAIQEVDVAIPAACDFAWSIMVVRIAGESGKHAVLAYPTGMLGRVTVIPPGKAVEEFFGLPPGLPYDTLRKLVNSPRLRRIFRRRLEFYEREGHWRKEWFERFLDGENIIPQICPMVWATASLGALEVLKLATSRFKPTLAPKHWYITPEGAWIKEFTPPKINLHLIFDVLREMQK